MEGPGVLERSRAPGAPEQAVVRGGCGTWHRGTWGPAHTGSVDLLLFPGGGREGAVGVRDELGAPHHHGQEEEAHEHHRGHGEALVHVNSWRRRSALHAGGPQVLGPEFQAAGGISAGQRQLHCPGIWTAQSLQS